MTHRQYVFLLLLWYASSDDLVVSKVEQKRFFSKVILELMEKLIFFMPVPVLRDRSSDDEVDHVRVPEGVTRDGEEILVWNCISDILFSRDVETR